jgi:hypothetical protein
VGLKIKVDSRLPLLQCWLLARRVREDREGGKLRRSVKTGLSSYQMFRAALDFLGTLQFVDCGLGPSDLAVLYSKT